MVVRVDFCDCFDAEYLSFGQRERRAPSKHLSSVCGFDERSSRRNGKFHVFPLVNKSRKLSSTTSINSGLLVQRNFAAITIWTIYIYLDFYRKFTNIDLSLCLFTWRKYGVFVAHTHTAVRIPLPCTDRITRLICCLMGVALLRCMMAPTECISLFTLNQTTTNVTVSKSAMIAIIDCCRMTFNWCAGTASRVAPHSEQRPPPSPQKKPIDLSHWKRNSWCS